MRFDWKFVVVITLSVIAIIAEVYPEWFRNDAGETVTAAPSPNVVDVREVDSFMKGQNKDLRGKVIKANEGGGNLYFTLQDVKNTATIKGVLFAKTDNKNPALKQMLLRSRDNQTVIYVKGKIDVYNGELEIIVFEVQDSQEKSVGFPKP